MHLVVVFSHHVTCSCGCSQLTFVSQKSVVKYALPKVDLPQKNKKNAFLFMNNKNKFTWTLLL